MLQKGTTEYRKAQTVANDLRDLAAMDKWNNNSIFELSFGQIDAFLEKVKETNTFAAKVAETVLGKMNPYNQKVAFISDKQSWILAAAAVEAGIEL